MVDFHLCTVLQLCQLSYDECWAML